MKYLIVGLRGQLYYKQDVARNRGLFNFFKVFFFFFFLLPVGVQCAAWGSLNLCMVLVNGIYFFLSNFSRTEFSQTGV